ncbi:MAG: OmpA family protein [Clostridia bacterium]|nr:OmpA family protein [Clostridia bacterium]
MFKKLATLFLAALMVVSFVACGNQDGSSNNSQSENQNGSNVNGNTIDGFVLEGQGNSGNTVPLGTPKTALNPQEVYDKLTYTPQMFYSKYTLLGGEDARNELVENTSTFKWSYNKSEVDLCVLPSQIRAGKQAIAHKLYNIKEYNWMFVQVPYRYRDNQYSFLELYCTYEIQGNKLILKALDTFSVDTETNKITYAFSDLVLEYTFEFRGRNITLTSGEYSVTLTTGLDAYCKIDYIFAEGYLSPDSKSANDIDYIRMRYDTEEKSSSLLFELLDETESSNSIATLEENGLFTFTLALENSQETYQYVYFLCGHDGLVLTDGTNTYYYNDTYSDRNKNDVSKYLTEDQTAKLDDLTDNQLEDIVEKTENLLDDLAKAYRDEGLNVTVNAQTGEIALDSTVLFAVNESDVSAEGKTFLQKFIQVYASVVFSDKYDNFVSAIMVEGHTDTTGSYELNQTLSQARADSVKQYCLSDDCGVDATYRSALQEMLQAVGYSYDKPIYKENGEVDMDASRRVSFRFIVNLD